MIKEIVRAPSPSRPAVAWTNAPPQEGEGPWLIFSHYHGAWHKRSEDGGACGYTGNFALAGVFDLKKAREYHDPPGGRDEAIPAERLVDSFEAHLAEMRADCAAFAAKIDEIRRAISPNRSSEPLKAAHGTARAPNTGDQQ